MSKLQCKNFISKIPRVKPGDKKIVQNKITNNEKAKV